ncbi:MAG: hypothetical protein Aurels2KO_56380 [Aureliella sp.]
MNLFIRSLALSGFLLAHATAFGQIPCPDECFVYATENDSCIQYTYESACDGDCSEATQNGDDCLTSPFDLPDHYFKNFTFTPWPKLEIPPFGESGFEVESCYHIVCNENSDCGCYYNAVLDEWQCKLKGNLFEGIQLQVTLNINTICDGGGLAP